MVLHKDFLVKEDSEMIMLFIGGNIFRRRYVRGDLATFTCTAYGKLPRKTKGPPMSKLSRAHHKLGLQVDLKKLFLFRLITNMAIRLWRKRKTTSGEEDVAGYHLKISFNIQ